MNPRFETIHPVVFEIPENLHGLKGTDKVDFLGGAARQALAESAKRSGIVLGALEKKDNGAPIPCSGIYWSLSHKSEAVGGVVSPNRVGIDIETIRPVTEPLYGRVAGETEWRLSASDRLETFFRFWTAKEAVLKAVGIGFAGMGKCRIVDIPDDAHLTIVYEDRNWQVEHFRTSCCLISVTMSTNPVQWHIEPYPG
ncbi:hypothetical protein D3OALGB2SA_5485 [Olavius algarvensis associated proteobacterium Delta 3]|nr:hypothetical protein D3OALGB2SA_5485 [Olavius algarvensis associated proteobacterium Delta 3]